MKLLTASIKKHRTALSVSIIFLCLEAVFCLISPAILGSLINTGVQSKGISDSYPRVMSRDTFSLFYEVLPEDRKSDFSDLYVLLNEAPDGFDEDYCAKHKSYYLRDSVDKEYAAELYRNAVWSAILMARNVDGFDAYNYDELVKNVSITSLYAFSEKIELTDEEILENYKQAETAADAVKLQAATLLMPYICEEAGLDCEHIQTEYIIIKTVELVVCVLLQIICAAVSARQIALFSAKAEEEMRTSLLNKTFRFSKRELALIPPSYLSSTVQSGVQQIGMAMNYGLRPLIYAPILGIVGSILVFRKSIGFGILVSAGSVLITAVIVLIYFATYKRYYRMQEKYGKYASTLRYNLRHFFSIRGNNAQSVEEKKVFELSKDIKKDESFVMKSVLSALSVTGLLINALTAVVVVTGGRTMLNLELTLGDIVTYLQYSVLIVTAFMMLGTIVIFAPKALKALKDIDIITDIEPYNDRFINNKETSPEVIDEITFDKVRIFENSPEISFTSQRGQITLITGKTGSGKTLLVDSLLREFTPFSGQILINGRNILDFDYEYPSKDISSVQSRPVLFSDTLRNNLILHGAENNDGKMLGALRAAQCDFLDYNSSTLSLYLRNSGEMFSGGQRSRISIAGGLAKPAKVYIFDDCFSALDDGTKEKILESISELKKDSVVIIISRGETEKKFADRIITI